MTYLSDLSTFTVPLALAAHVRAEGFRQQHSQSDKAKQIYLNSLAVYAVSIYLDCIAIDTDLAASDSSNPLQQTLLDTADLVVRQGGKLECRPVLPGETELWIPPEVHHDRIGYVAVQLSEDLRQATLLGFLPTVRAERISLHQLQPIEMLGNVLAEKIAASQPIHLSQWLQNLAEAGWQAVDNFGNNFTQPTDESQLAWGFRGDAEVGAEIALPRVQRCKQFQLSRYDQQVTVSLVVGLCSLPKDDAERESKDDVEIWVELRPAGLQRLLPSLLQLLVLDQLDHEVMQAQARSTEAIKLKFTGLIGERFSIKIIWHETSINESFVI